MYNYNFKIHFKNVPSNVGRYHIHCPEHISSVHKLGVPGFKITKVDTPQISQNNDLALSISIAKPHAIVTNLYWSFMTSMPPTTFGL